MLYIYALIFIVYRFSLNFYRKIFASIIFITTFAAELSIIVKNTTLKTDLKTKAVMPKLPKKLNELLIN